MFYGFNITFVDPDDLSNFENAVQDNTKAIFFETLGNPNSNLIDIEGLAEIAHRHNIPLVVDATFTTPYLLRPIEYGVDIVVHSATKFIGRQFFFQKHPALNLLIFRKCFLRLSN